MTYLPSKSLVGKLMANYWKVVHLISHTVHRPTFERQYEAFWRSIASGIEPRMSFQAVLFAALLGSIISMPKEKVLAEFGVDKQPLVDNFQQGTEAALAKANFLRTTKLETLQAFVMYLVSHALYQQCHSIQTTRHYPREGIVTPINLSLITHTSSDSTLSSGSLPSTLRSHRHMHPSR